jgi:hypothetical protein
VNGEGASAGAFDTQPFEGSRLRRPRHPGKPAMKVWVPKDAQSPKDRAQVEAAFKQYIASGMSLPYVGVRSTPARPPSSQGADPACP